jgi:hypothetical protein
MLVMAGAFARSASVVAMRTSHNSPVYFVIHGHLYVP